jgi:signal transduction histidine kinase
VDLAPEPLAQQDRLAQTAYSLATSLELFSRLLAEPGVLVSEYQHYAEGLAALSQRISSVLERVAKIEGASAVPVFRREPLRPAPSRSPGSPVPGAVGQTDVGSVVKSCEPLLAAIAGPNVAMNVAFDAGLGPLVLSNDALTRVLINLVQNASEAMPSGGRVAVTVRRGLGASPSAIISVQDTGSGIPAHALGQIFQAGFTSRPSGRKWPSAMHHGLGLTVVRELVEGAGGTVRVTSTLKKGSTFELKLPCRR